MKDKLQTWLHDLGVALGLLEPPMQPVPIPVEDPRERKGHHRQEQQALAEPLAGQARHPVVLLHPRFLSPETPGTGACQDTATPL